MTVLCDTNVILDVLLDREPFAEDSSRVLKRMEEHRDLGFITASSVTDIFYLVRKYSGNLQLTYQAMERLLKIVSVWDVTEQDIRNALERRSGDFEDCVMAVCAKRHGCKTIVTRNEKDFAGTGISALSPAAYLKQFE